MHSKHLGFLIALGLGALFLDSACQPAPVARLECGSHEVYGYRRCWLRADVRLNSVGFLEERQKLAAYSGDETRFEIRSAEDDEIVFEGEAGEERVWEETGETLRIADFSEFREAGEYYLTVRGGGARSAQFQIGRGALEAATSTSILAMYGQRCGEAVHIEYGEEEYSHGECHLSEAKLDHAKYPAESGDGAAGAAGAAGAVNAAGPKKTSLDDTGGWHDAGDYGKYTVNGAFALAYYLKAFEEFEDEARSIEVAIPERDNGIPDLLDESRVELEWLLKVQFPNGAFSHKVTGLKFEGNVMPENDLQTRYFTEVGSAATGDAAAVLALAARLYREFDEPFAERCLSAARRGAAFLAENPGLITPDLSLFSTGSYLAGDGDLDERLWVLVELFETTGELEYLAPLEELLKLEDMNTGRPRLSIQQFIDWYGTSNLAFVTYARSERPERDPELVEAVEAGIVEVADAMVSEAARDPYGRASRRYSWGGNGGVARMTHVLAAAHSIAPDEAYLDAIQSQVDHLFGRNPFSRSFVTGVGHYPPINPHHRPSGDDGIGEPWPGLLIGGPHADGDVPGNPLAALNWADSPSDYWHNEIAINWNTALTYALIALLGSSE